MAGGKAGGRFTGFCVFLSLFLSLTGRMTASGQVEAQEQPFTVSTSYKSLLSNSEQTGMLDLIVKEAFRRIGIEAEIVFNPTERSLADVDAGLLDAELNRIEGMEKKFPNLVRVPEPNMVMDFVAFSKKDYQIDGWKSIKDFHIGLVSGWKILEENTKGFPHVVTVPTETELFNMLDLDRIDLALYSKLTGYEQIHLRGLKEIHHLEPPLESRNMYLYVHKRHSGLVHPLAEALRSMKKDGTYGRIVHEATSHLTGDE